MCVSKYSVESRESDVKSGGERKPPKATVVRDRCRNLSHGGNSGNAALAREVSTNFTSTISINVLFWAVAGDMTRLGAIVAGLANGVQWASVGSRAVS